MPRESTGPPTGLNHRQIAVTGTFAVLVIGLFVILLSRLAAGTAGDWLIVSDATALGVSAVLLTAYTGRLAWTMTRTARQPIGCTPAGPGGDRPTGWANAQDETTVLDHAFNVRANSLHETREELEQLVGEQTALRRVAMLVANAAPTSAIFSSVTAEVGQILGADLTRMLRYEPDHATTVIAAWDDDPTDILPVDTRWTIVGRNIPSMVLHKCRPARMDCFIGAVSPLCVYLRGHGIRSGVGTPVIVDGRCWGVMIAFSTRQRLLPQIGRAHV